MLINPYIYSSLSLDDFSFITRIEAENTSKYSFDCISSTECEITTTIKQFGVSALSNDGGSTNYAESTNLGGLDLNNNDFAIELWINAQAGDADGRGIFLSKRGLATERSFNLLHFSGKLTFYYSTTGTSLIAADFTLPTIPVSEWHKITIARNGVNLRAYYDEDAIGGIYDIGTDTIYNSTSPVRVGGDSFNITGFRGQIDELRISDTNRGFTGTTIPTQSTAYEKDVNTLALFHFDGQTGDTLTGGELQPDNLGSANFLNDISGNYNHMYPTSIVYNESGQNSLPDLMFNGSTSFANQSSFILTQPFVMYMVANIDADTVVQELCGDSNAQLRITADEYLQGNAGSNLTYSTDVSGSSKLFTFEVNGVNSKLYVDKVEVASGDVGSGALASLSWGKISSSYSSMDSSCLLVQNNVDDVDDINTALFNKYIS